MSAALRALPLPKDDVSNEIARKRSINGYDQASGEAARAPKTFAHVLANVLQVRSHSHRAYAHNLWAYPNLSSVPASSEAVVWSLPHQNHLRPRLGTSAAAFGSVLLSVSPAAVTGVRKRRLVCR